MLFPLLVNRFGRGKKLIRAILVLLLASFLWRLRLYETLIKPNKILDLANDPQFFVTHLLVI